MRRASLKLNTLVLKDLPYVPLVFKLKTGSLSPPQSYHLLLDIMRLCPTPPRGKKVAWVVPIFL